MSTIDDILAKLSEVDAEAGRRHRQSERMVEDARAPSDIERRTVTAGLTEAPAYRAVSIQPTSSNRKLAPCTEVKVRDSRGTIRTRPTPTGPYVASTYTSIAATCPTSCTFRDNGCYAQAGQSHLVMGRLDQAGRRTTALEVSLAEAEKLDALWPNGVPQDGARGGRDLRLHVGGDVSCTAGAMALSHAVMRLRGRGLGESWTYTHRWREIPADAWSTIAALASVETPGEARRAGAGGYAPALTVDHFPSRRRFPIGGGWSAIPCPYESGRGVTCSTCRLCFDVRRLRESRLAIAFAVHGAASDAAKTRLRVLNGAP